MDHSGIIPRSIRCLFDTISVMQERAQRRYTVYCSYLQIYNEKIFDLLNPIHFVQQGSSNTAGLKLRYKDGIFIVDNLYQIECKSPNEIFHLFHSGLKNRIIASHKLNHASSRSHSILSITIESFDLINSVSIPIF